MWTGGSTLLVAEPRGQQAQPVVLGVQLSQLLGEGPDIACSAESYCMVVRQGLSRRTDPRLGASACLEGWRICAGADRAGCWCPIRTRMATLPHSTSGCAVGRRGAAPRAGGAAVAIASRRPTGAARRPTGAAGPCRFDRVGRHGKASGRPTRTVDLYLCEPWRRSRHDDRR